MTVWTIARVTLGEAIRRKVLLVFLLVALALLLFSVIFAIFTPREEITMIISFGMGVITFASAAIAVFGTAGLIPIEIEKRTIYTILAKPVQRYQFVLGKFIGAALTILINLVAMAVVFYLVVVLKSMRPHFQIFYGLLMIYFQMVLLSAVTMTLSVFTTQIITITGALFVYIIGNISEYVQSLIQITQTPFVRILLRGLHLIVPNFSNFNVVNSVVHPENYPMDLMMLKYASTTVGWGAIYVVALMLLAVLLFQWREI